MHAHLATFAPIAPPPPCPGSPVARWEFDALVGQIHALDGQGRLLMAIGASPWFGARLAAAFDPPPAQRANGMPSYNPAPPGGLQWRWA